MNLVLMKVIIALLSFIVTNPDIPQSVKDQSLVLVSETLNIESVTEAIPKLGAAPKASEILIETNDPEAAAIREMRANVDPNRACKSQNRKLNRILHLMCEEDGL